MKDEQIKKLISGWLKENTRGLKKNFSKTALIFSYYDILELKEYIVRRGRKWKLRLEQ